MKETDFTFPSADGIHEIHAIRWEPEGKIRAVVQIAHGMEEHMERYTVLAEALTEHGILVTGNDHLGHGKSVRTEEELGFFAEENGNGCILADMETLRKLTAEKFPGIPYYFFGHSMGSFLVRQYIAVHGDRIRGAVIAGTGQKSSVLMSAGRLICNVISLVKGWHYRSGFVNELAFGKFNERFGEKGGFDWLTADEKALSGYHEDPLCGFMFTVNGFYNMFTSIGLLTKDAYIKRMPRELPVLLIAGTDDPVGDFGKGPLAVKESYEKLGMKDVTLRLYPGARHELINESVRETVFSDLLNWINEHEKDAE